MTGARGEPAGPHRADRLNTKTQSHPRDWELQHMSQDDVAYHHRYINQDAADPAYNDPKTKGPDRWGSTNKRSKRDSIKAFIGRLTGGGSSDDDELDPDKKGKGEDKGKKRETMVPGANPRDSSPSRDSFIAGPAYHKLVNSEAGGPADYGEPIEPISPIDERGPITPTREQDDSTVSIMSNESMERRRKEAQEDMASPDGEAGPSGSSKPMFPPARDPSPVSSERRASKFRESL